MKMAIQIIIDCMMWFGAGLNVAALIQSRRLLKRSEATLAEAEQTEERNYTLIQFSMEFNKCETADDIIDLQQRWHERLKEVDIDFNDIVKFERE